MSNGEHDFDQVRVCDTAWIAAHPQDGHEWSLSEPSRYAADICNGYDAKYLISAGPFGIRDHQAPNGQWVYRLNPAKPLMYGWPLSAE